MKRKSKILWTLIAVLTICVLFCAVYVSDYYHADIQAISAFAPEVSVERQKIDENTVVYVPDTPTAGLIFYPGGKVEYTSYEPLMKSCAAEGILCALVEMPFNLAVLDINAAEGIQEHYSDIENWYIGGHSLGGSMAASYLADHIQDYEGLILLGSYSTADLSGSGLNVLSVYGSEDMVLNRKKYTENQTNLPADFTELILDGGCHAYFGMYGEQDGDGTPTLSNAEQIDLTTQAIVGMIMN